MLQESNATFEENSGRAGLAHSNGKRFPSMASLYGRKVLKHPCTRVANSETNFFPGDFLANFRGFPGYF